MAAELLATREKAAARTSRAATARTAQTAAAARAMKIQQRRTSVLAFARAQVGKPYRHGAAGPRAFDCSGLTMKAFKQAGVKLPHSASRQGRRGKVVSRKNARPGDLMTWPGMTHAAIYAGGNRMIDASVPGAPIRVNKIWGKPRFHRLVG